MNDIDVRSVIVPIDDSDRAERALAYAMFVATRLDAEVRLLAVAESPSERLRLEHGLERARIQVGEHIDHARVAYDFWAAERIVAAAAPRHAVACIATDWSSDSSFARQVVFHSDGPVLLLGPNADPVPRIDGVVVTACGGGPSDHSLVAASASWATALDLRHTIIAPEGKPAPAPAATAELVTVGEADPVDAALDYQRDHAVFMVAATVPVVGLRHVGRAARAASRLIRSSRTAVLAHPYR